jgi:hypothetical protein
MGVFIMVKKIMLVGSMLMSMSAYSMHPIVSMTFDAIRYASMAWHPWSAAKSTIEMSKISPKERQRALDCGAFTVADESTTCYIHELIGDSNVRIIIAESPGGSEGVSATRELFSGEKVIYINPALVPAIHKTNVPLSASAFKEARDGMYSSFLPRIKEKIRQENSTEKDVNALVNEFRDQLIQLNLSSHTQAEIDAMLKHEYRHIENRDTHRTLAYQLLTPIGLAGLDKILQRISAPLLPSLKNKIPFLVRKSLITGMGAYCYFKATPYVLAALAREKERQADTAIIMSDDKTLKGGLHKFHKQFSIEEVLPPAKSHLLKNHPFTLFRAKRCYDELVRREE